MVENVWAEINGARIIVLYKHLMKIYKVAYNLAKEYFLTAFAWKERKIFNCVISTRELMHLLWRLLLRENSTAHLLSSSIYVCFSGPSWSLCTRCCSSLWPNASEIWLSHYYIESCEGTIFWICSMCLIFNIMLLSVESLCNFGYVLKLILAYKWNIFFINLILLL